MTDDEVEKRIQEILSKHSCAPMPPHFYCETCWFSDELRETRLKFIQALRERDHFRDEAEKLKSPLVAFTTGNGCSSHASFCSGCGDCEAQIP